MMKFKVGDTVRLKSGGTTMTISEITAEHDEAECVWFDHLRFKRYWFKATMLAESREPLTLEELLCGPVESEGTT